MGESASEEPRYQAFLSYSHKDAQAAGRLHRRLESYRLPRRLVGKETERGTVPQRLTPIFRDREELAAASDLSATVRAALSRSSALIVLCSPDAATSLWVNEEIRTFRELYPDRPVLAAILAGTVPDCFPPALRALDGDGEWHEPLATDLRPGADGAHLGLLKLVAGLAEVALDDLVQRDAHRKIRRVTAVTAAALVAMLVMAALTLFALDARREAERQRAEAEGLVEYMLTDLRHSLKSVGRLDVMANVNQRALAYYEGQGPLENLPPDSLERWARIIGAMGEDEENRGNLDRARSRYEVLHRTTAALLKADPANPARILAHAQSENRLGLLAYAQDQFPVAGGRWTATRTLLSSIADWGRDRQDWLRLASYVEGNSCAVLLRQGRGGTFALDHCRRAVAYTERLAAMQTGDASASYDLVFHLYWLAEAQEAAGQAAPARGTQARYLELMARLVAREPDNMLWREQQMELYVRHSRFLRAQGRLEEAARFHAEARAISERLAARDPRNAVWDGYRQRLSATPARSE